MSTNINHSYNNKRSRLNNQLQKLEELEDSDEELINNNSISYNAILFNEVISDESDEYKLPYMCGLDRPDQCQGLSKEELDSNNIPSESYVYKQSQNGPLFYANTCMQPAEFIMLLQIIEPVYSVTPIIQNNNNNDNNNNTTRVSARKLTCADALFLYLLMLDGTNFALIAMIFDLTIPGAYYYSEFMQKIVNSVLEHEIRWPDSEERKSLYGLIPIFDRAVAIMDGTHCEIQIPSDSEIEWKYYSGYKHYHTQNYLIIIDIHGFIRYLEGPFPGRMSDTGVFQRSHFIDHVDEYLSGGERILADGGFKGFPQLLIPYTKDVLAAPSLSSKQLDERLEYNSSLTMTRSKVEHAIRRIKTVARGLAMTYNRDKIKQKCAIESAVKLHNWLRKTRISVQQNKLN